MKCIRQRFYRWISPHRSLGLYRQTIAQLTPSMDQSKLSIELKPTSKNLAPAKSDSCTSLEIFPRSISTFLLIGQVEDFSMLFWALSQMKLEDQLLGQIELRPFLLKILYTLEAQIFSNWLNLCTILVTPSQLFMLTWLWINYQVAGVYWNYFLC